AELRLHPRSYDPANPDLRLVWRVTFSGISEASYVDVDATTNQATNVQPTSYSVVPCSGFDPAHATLSGHVARTVSLMGDTSTPMTRSDMLMGTWTQGSSTFTMFDNEEPFKYSTMFMPQALNAYTQFVCEGSDPDNDKIASVHWLIQHAAKTFEDQ